MFEDLLPCKGMAALGGSRHALINLSTQIDIPPIIKKSLSPATGYFGHKDEQSHHLNTFYGNTAQLPNEQKYDIIDIWKDK